MGDILNEFIIKNYINKLSSSDIHKFGKKNGINLSNDELNIIMYHIKNNYHTIIYDDPKKIFDDLKVKLSNINYEKIENLYIEFKTKYKNYL